MLNLDSTINLDFKKFLDWWGRELSFLIPEKLKQIIHNQQGQLIIRPSDDKLEVSFQANGDPEPVAEVQRDASGLAELKALLEQGGRFDKAKIVIRLNDQYAIARELVFPLAAAENLQQVVAYELDRYTPFNPETAYFAVKLLETNKASGQVRIMLVLSPKDKTDVLYEELTGSGLRPDLVDYESVENNTGVAHYNLLPEALRHKPAILPKLVHGGLWGALMVLSIAVLVLPVWWQNQTVSELRSKIEDIEREAQEVDKLQAEMDALIAQTRQLIDKKRGSPSLVELLNVLSALIKDDTWLTYFHYTGGRLQFQGQSPSASTLIAVLEESSQFANARFVSPVTQDIRSGLERFQITVDVKPRRQ